jgi:multiple sugar transport system permease protein
VVAVAERGLMRRGADVFESRRILASALIAPAVIFIVLLVGTPFVLAIYLSFTDATAGSLSGTWVGFDNFSTAWHDPIFRHALRNTAVMTLMSQAIVVVCAAILSNYLAKPFRGRWFLRFLILLPWAAPVALAAITWLWIYDGLYSVINWTLVHAGLIGPACALLHHWPFQVGECTSLNTPQWLGQENLAMAAIITVHAWRVLPFAVVIFLAGHASIPLEVEDAAKVDGATGLRKLIYVTLPLQLPIALVAVLFGLIFTATDMAVVYILTNGGPFNSTQVITTWAFQTGVQGGSLGEGAAISLFLLPVLAVVTIAMLFFARRSEVA